MPEQNGISIIITTAFKNDYLQSLLASIRAQIRDLPVYELIVVVDDDRSEHTLDTNGFVRVVEIRNGRSLGPSRCKNLAAQRASCKWLLFLDDDTLLEPDFFKNALAELDSGKSIDCLQPMICDYDDPEMVSSTGGIANMFGFAWDRDHKRPVAECLNAGRNILFATTAAMFVRRSLWKRVGGFDASFWHSYEDADFGFRMIKMGCSVVYYPEVKVRHKMGGTVGRYKKRAVFLRERNRLLFLLKNFQGRTILKACPGMVYNLFKRTKRIGIERSLRKKTYFLTLIRAYLSLIMRIPMVILHRSRSRRLVSDSDIFSMLELSPYSFPSFSMLNSEQKEV